MVSKDDLREVNYVRILFQENLEAGNLGNLKL